jgi:hypothetical protein
MALTSLADVLCEQHHNSFRSKVYLKIVYLIFYSRHFTQRLLQIFILNRWGGCFDTNFFKRLRVYGRVVDRNDSAHRPPYKLSRDG